MTLDEEVACENSPSFGADEKGGSPDADSCVGLADANPCCDSVTEGREDENASCCEAGAGSAEVPNEAPSTQDALAACEGEPDESKPQRARQSCADASEELAVSQISAVLETVLKLEKMFVSKIERSEYELESLKKQSAEIQEYKSDLYASILSPVLRGVSKAHSAMVTSLGKAKDKGEGFVSVKEFEFAIDDLGEILEDAGVDLLEFSEGDAFETNMMKIVGKNPVSDPEKNKTVKSASSVAYIFKGSTLEKARTIVNVLESE